MTVLAVRTYEPWTVGSLLTGLVIIGVIVAILIFALRRGNR
ncbi:MAG: hypothetical protein WBM90_03390 [Acidimicrobiia bacterium]